VTFAARAVAVGLALLPLACSKPSGDSVAVASPSASAAPAGAAAPMPVLKEYAAPPADRLGVCAPGTGIAVGQRVPAGRARDLDGNDVTLASLYPRGPLLLAFYRGGWCPYCNSEIHALTAAYPEYQKRGVLPVAISVDKPDAEAKMKATYQIPFPVLSDSHADVVTAFNLVKKVGDEEFAKMKGFGVDLESYSGETHHVIAIPALFLIDRGGVVRWAHSDPDFKVRPSTVQILAAIDAIHLSGS
jgi:peroxiredoxin